MRTYYKYKYGFINIDDNIVYMSATGNWSETKSLNEKKFGQSSKNNIKIIFFYTFLIAVFLFVCYAIVTNHKHIFYKFISLISITLGIFSIKKYFNTEIGERFLIPKNKIIEINSTDQTLSILFTTKDNFREIIVLNDVEGDIENLKFDIHSKTN